MAAEERTTLNLGIATDERSRSFGTDALDLRQFDGALGTHVRIGHGRLEGNGLGVVRVHLRVGRKVVEEGQTHQPDDAGQHGEHEGDVEPMPELPLGDERHQRDNAQYHARNNLRTNHLGAAREEVQELEQKQEVPFGTGGIERCREVGGWAQVGTAVRPRTIPDAEDDRYHQHPEAGHGITQELVGEVGGVFRAVGTSRLQTVSTADNHVERDDDQQQQRQQPGMQRKEPRERVVPEG